MKVINAENTVLGRLASEAAKLAMNGEEVVIINAEKAVITGNPDDIYERYFQKFQIRDIAKPEKSPKMSRRPDLFVKRTIRGMIPRRRKNGKEALSRIKAFIGTPKEYEGKGEVIENIIKKNKKGMTVEELCKKLGWKG